MQLVARQEAAETRERAKKGNERRHDITSPIESSKSIESSLPLSEVHMFETKSRLQSDLHVRWTRLRVSTGWAGAQEAESPVERRGHVRAPAAALVPARVVVHVQLRSHTKSSRKRPRDSVLTVCLVPYPRYPAAHL